MNQTQRAWEKKKFAGALFMDVKPAFNNVGKTILGKRMEELGVEAVLIRWTMSFMTDRRVKYVLDGEVGDENPVDTGVPQGSPAAPILFVTYLSGILDAVEQAAPGISGLLFVDNVGWWAEGKNADEVAGKLTQAAAAAIEWAGRNGVAFDHRKTEAALFWRRKRNGTLTAAMVKVGGKEVPFNREATRWLRVWLDSQLTLKEHHATRRKSGRNAMNRLRRLTGRMGLSPANCRRIMTACVQSAAMFGAELWWKGRNVRGTTGRAEELQLLVNQQARASTGAFWTTNLGALAMESGLRPASNQLENRQWRFGLRLLSLPQGDKARKVAIGCTTTIGKRLKTALNRTWTSTEQTILLEDPEPFDAALSLEERGEAKKEAEKERLGLVMFTDGSRLESEAAGYAVAWQNGQTWEGIKTHMGYNQEAYDTECAALERALETATRRVPTPSHVTIFTDAQAAIKRMSSDEPAPGQKYALEARQHIAELWRKAPSTIIEIRWCPAHEGVEGNEQADKWAKLAAEEPDTPGVEWPDKARPRSLANIRREILEKKWAQARKWAGGRTSKKRYKMPKSQKPDGTVAGSTKRFAERFYQLKMGHARTGDYLHRTKSRPTPQCWWCPHPRQTREHLLKGCPKWRKQQKVLWKEVWEKTGGGRFRWKAHELFAEEECSQAVLEFLSTTEVGKTVPGVAGGEDAGSEVSEGELWERAEREEEGGEEGKAQGDGEEPLFLPTPPFMASAGGEYGTGAGVSFLCTFLGAFLPFSRNRPGQRAEGGLHCTAARGLRRGNGLYIWARAPRHDLLRSHTSTE